MKKYRELCSPECEYYIGGSCRRTERKCPKYVKKPDTFILLDNDRLFAIEDFEIIGEIKVGSKVTLIRNSGKEFTGTVVAISSSVQDLVDLTNNKQEVPHLL